MLRKVFLSQVTQEILTSTVNRFCGLHFVEQRALNPSAGIRQRTAERLLLLLFLFSLPLLNPWVRGDGVGYYAFARAPLIQHNLDFAPDYQSANASFRGPRLDSYGQPKSAFRTATGHLDNHFTVGPAILWSPSSSLRMPAFLLRAPWVPRSPRTVSPRPTAWPWRSRLRSTPF